MKTQFTAVGHLHSALSRRDLEAAVHGIRARRLEEKPRSAKYKRLTRDLARAEGSLKTRRALSLLTLPMDAVLGTRRERAESFSDLASHPADAGAVGMVMTAVTVPVCLATAVAGMLVGAPVGALVGQPAAGAKAGAFLLTVPVGLAGQGVCEIAAAPSALVKLAGTGVGAAVGSAVGVVKARYS